MSALACLQSRGLHLNAHRQGGAQPAHSLAHGPRAVLASRAPQRLRTVARAAAEACDLDVTARYCGLTPVELEAAFRGEHPGLLEALAGAAAAMTPGNAAPLLARLEAELPPTLTDVAPGGDCVLVAIAPGLVPLLEHAVSCCEASLASGRPRCAVGTASATLRLLSRLRFGSRASSEPYAAIGTRCKQVLKAAYDAGAAITQEGIVELHCACARASPWLWLTPYFGYRCAVTVDDFITAGWSCGELAVRFTEAYAQLMGSGRYTQVTGKWVRLVRAALQHPLTASQVQRLLDADKLLPVDLNIQMELHARSEPADCWYAQLRQRLRQEQRAEAAVPAAAAATTAVTPAATSMAANGAVPLGSGWVRQAAGKQRA